MTTIGLVANVYNEANALPGWLETHTPFFDHIAAYHSGPQGAFSNDGTIEILQKWKIPVAFGSIDKGYGAVRTEAIRFSPCDWVMLLDADERFYPLHRVLTCSGESDPHSEVDRILSSYTAAKPSLEHIDQLGAKLRVDVGQVYDQGRWLREILTHNLDGVVTVRRHWHDFSFRRPTQNWQHIPDWQMRVVRNDPSIHFDPNTRMHERMCGVNNVFHADMERGPFFDHFHFTFKRMELEQRAHDVAIYNAIHEGRTPPTREEYDRGR